MKKSSIALFSLALALVSLALALATVMFAHRGESSVGEYCFLHEGFCPLGSRSTGSIMMDGTFYSVCCVNTY